MVKISASVGKGGKNKKPDVEAVQKALNKFASSCGFKKLDVDGLNGPNTEAAIKKFQEKVCGFKPDGRVDPGKTTVSKLGEDPKKAADDRKKEADDKKKADDAKKGNGAGGAPAPAGGGKVVGPVSGLDSKIVNVLKDIANFFGCEIKVTSGKRSETQQADIMYRYWDKHIERGNLYVYLRSNPRLKERLDELFNEGKKDEFMQCILKDVGPRNLSRHLSGEAVDVSLSTPRNVLAAISSCLKYVPEYSGGQIKCHHFDNRKIEWPIKEATKAKWKR